MIIQLGVSVQALTHRLDSMASPCDSSTSAEASTHVSPAHHNHPPQEHDRSCQVGQSLLEELCYCWRQHESQATHALHGLHSSHGLQSPPALSCASLPPPPESLLSTPEPQALSQSASEPPIITQAPGPEADTWARGPQDAQSSNPSPHHLGHSAAPSVTLSQNTMYHAVLHTSMPVTQSGLIAAGLPSALPNAPCVCLPLLVVVSSVTTHSQAPADIPPQLPPTQPAAPFHPYLKQQPKVPPVTLPVYQTASFRSGKSVQSVLVHPPTPRSSIMANIALSSTVSLNTRVTA